MSQTDAGWAIEQYLARSIKWERTRFTPSRKAITQRDPLLPNTVFYRYPDGSAIRLDTGREHDIQEF